MPGSWALPGTVGQMHSRTRRTAVRHAVSAGALSLLLLGAAACGGSSDEGADQADGSSSPSPTQQQPEQAAAPKPELGDVPQVVAVVNGQKISKQEFADAYRQRLQSTAAQGGQAPVDQDQLKKQTAESLVSTELLAQAAEKKKLRPSAKEVDARIEELAGQNQMKPAQLLQALQAQGLDEGAVRDQIGTQVAVEKLVEAEGGSTKPTDQEVRAYYQQVKAQQEQSGGNGQAQQLPPLKQVRPQIEQQLASQKQAQVAQQLVQRYRRTGTVTINL